jgi:hypothetical protein
MQSELPTICSHVILESEKWSGHLSERTVGLRTDGTLDGETHQLRQTGQGEVGERVGDVLDCRAVATDPQRKGENTDHQL